MATPAPKLATYADLCVLPEDLREVDASLGRHDIVRPDLSGWRRERLPRLAAKRPIEVVPDWV